MTVNSSCLIKVSLGNAFYVPLFIMTESNVHASRLEMCSDVDENASSLM